MATGQESGNREELKPPPPPQKKMLLKLTHAHTPFSHDLDRSSFQQMDWLLLCVVWPLACSCCCGFGPLPDTFMPPPPASTLILQTDSRSRVLFIHSQPPVCQAPCTLTGILLHVCHRHQVWLVLGPVWLPSLTAAATINFFFFWPLMSDEQHPGSPVLKNVRGTRISVPCAQC